MYVFYRMMSFLASSSVVCGPSAVAKFLVNLVIKESHGCENFMFYSNN